MIDAIISIISLLTGYYLGSQRSLKSDLKDLKKTGDNAYTWVSDQVAQDAEEEFVAGPIMRPSAREIYLRNQPEKVRASKEAIEEDLDKIPELARLKR